MIVVRTKSLVCKNRFYHLYGQFYADEIEVHQQSKLEIVPFKPEQEPSGYALYTQQ